MGTDVVVEAEWRLSPIKITQKFDVYYRKTVSTNAWALASGEVWFKAVEAVSNEVRNSVWDSITRQTNEGTHNEHGGR